MAGYSGTPLVRKLGIKAGHRVALLGAPDNFGTTLGALPAEVTLRTDLRAKGMFDVIVCFSKSQMELRERFEGLMARLDPAGGLWIAWPKRASRVPTDITEDVVRAVALEAGLVDNKVCAVDNIWSGLRLVYRLQDRPGRGKKAKEP